MATRCEKGFVFDDGGICGCGAGHEDQARMADDVARAHGAILPHSCTVPMCPRPGCGLTLEAGGHADECMSYWHDAAAAN